MYCKYIDKNTIEPFTGKILKYDGNIYANPTAATLKAHGYKPLIEAAQLDEKEGYYRKMTYTEDKNNVYGVESYEKIPDEVSEIY